LGKVLLVFLGPLFGMPLPLLPFQILWLNLVTDGVLGLGIGVEAAERDAMRRPPQATSVGILDRGVIHRVCWLGALLGAVNLTVAWWAFSTRQPAWQTIVMSTVVLLQIVEAHVGRSWTESVFRLNPLTNRALLAGTGAVLLLQAAAMYVPPLPQLFGTAPLAAYQLVVPLIAGWFVLSAVEIAKQIGRPA
jgi:Ca2+-transporting ATPase